MDTSKLAHPKPERRASKGPRNTKLRESNLRLRISNARFPKPEPRARTKARKARTEAAVEKAVRAADVVRDGYCRLFVGFEPWHQQGHREWADIHRHAVGGCKGPSQLTHLPPKTRAHTMGLPPEERHSTAWTIQACEFHHDRIDGRRRPKLILTPTTPAGADGPLTVSVK